MLAVSAAARSTCRPGVLSRLCCGKLLCLGLGRLAAKDAGHHRGRIGFLHDLATNVSDQLDTGGALQDILWPVAGQEGLELTEVPALPVGSGCELSHPVRGNVGNLLGFGGTPSGSLRRIGALLEQNPREVVPLGRHLCGRLQLDQTCVRYLQPAFDNCDLSCFVTDCGLGGFDFTR
jgi:hypothetical protein